MKPMEALIDAVLKPGWEETLSAPPHSLHIRKHPDRPLYIFRYDMIETDFSNPLARAARGCILEILPFSARVVCYALDKFFNAGEKWADPIDSSTARSMVKIDGSIIKLFYDASGDGWTWATNNGFDAMAELPGFLPVIDEPASRGATTFADLIAVAIKNQGLDDRFVERLSRQCTYWFELTSPRNRIVVPYEQTKLWFLGCRDNATYAEIDPLVAAVEFDIPFQTPAQIDYENMEDWLSKHDQFGGTIEGLVVYDADFRRVKMKTKSYVAMHRLKGERQFSMEHLLDCIKDGTFDDVGAVFPEYREQLDELSVKVSAIKKYLAGATIDAEAFLMHQPDLDDRVLKKVFAEWVFDKYPEISSYMFAALKIKVERATEEFFKKLTYDRLEKMYEGITHG